MTDSCGVEELEGSWSRNFVVSVEMVFCECAVPDGCCEMELDDF